MKHSESDKGSLGGVASRALGWSFFNNTFARLGTLAIGITLARLLGPHEFGTFAVALLALLALLSFNELGVSLAIVRWQGEPREIAPTVSTISVLGSLIIYAGCFLAAPLFARTMGAPAAASVIRVLGLNIVVDGIVATPAALMQRYFRQDKKMIADQVNCWLGAGISVLLAWQHFGAMSLAVGRLAGAVAAGVLFVIFSPLPLRFGYNRDKARALYKFGLPLAGASIVVFAVTNVDQVVVGHLLGTTALGLFALAFNLASWPVNMFSLPVRSVAPSAFSRLQDDKPAMRSAFVTIAGLLVSTTLPICLLIAGAAVPILRLVYGPAYVPAAPALVWLAVLGGQRILFEFVYDFFVVLARSRVVFTVQVVWLIALVPALIAGTLWDGIGGAALAEVAVAALLVVPWYLAELSRFGIRRRSLAATLWLPVVAAVAVGFGAAGFARVIAFPLGACIASGLMTLVVIAGLCFRMRSGLVLLKPAFSRNAHSEGAADADSVAAVVDEVIPPEQVVKSRPAASAAAQAAGLSALLALASPGFHDMTGPLPMYRDPSAGPLTYQKPPAPRRDSSPPGAGTVPAGEAHVRDGKYALEPRDPAPGAPSRLSPSAED
jgi:O-antigen/teichoic acid export membrane protein